MTDLKLSAADRRARAVLDAAAGKKAKALAASGVDVVDFSIGEPDFATPGLRRPRGRRGDRGRAHEVHRRGRRGRRCATRSPRSTGASRAPSRARERHRDGRREAGGLQRLPGALRGGRRGRAVLALLGLVSRDGAADRRAAASSSRPTLERRLAADGGGARARARRAATRGVILNSPNNPTGAVVDAEELARILDWCAARDAWLIFDETYDRFLYDGRRHVSAAALRPGIASASSSPARRRRPTR